MGLFYLSDKPNHALFDALLHSPACIGTGCTQTPTGFCPRARGWSPSATYPGRQRNSAPQPHRGCVSRSQPADASPLGLMLVFGTSSRGSPPAADNPGLCERTPSGFETAESRSHPGSRRPGLKRNYQRSDRTDAFFTAQPRSLACPFKFDMLDRWGGVRIAKSLRTQPSRNLPRGDEICPARTTALHLTTRRAEEHFTHLVAGVQDYAIFLLDPNGVVKTWNASG